MLVNPIKNDTSGITVVLFCLTLLGGCHLEPPPSSRSQDTEGQTGTRIKENQTSPIDQGTEDSGQSIARSSQFPSNTNSHGTAQPQTNRFFSQALEGQSQKPEITSIVMPYPIKLEVSEKITVYVIDRSSSVRQPPSLEFIPIRPGLRRDGRIDDITPFISFSSRRMISEFYWEFEYTLNTHLMSPPAELMYDLNVVALSASNRQSLGQRIAVEIARDGYDPIIIGPVYTKVYKGKRNHISFQVIGHPSSTRLSAILLDPHKQERWGQVELFQERINNNLHVSLVWDLESLNQGPQWNIPRDYFNILIVNSVEPNNGPSFAADKAHLIVYNVK